MTYRKIVTLVLLLIFLPVLILWLIAGHPYNAKAADIGTQFHRDKPFTEAGKDAITGAHLYSITQELIWDGGRSDQYPFGRVYHLTGTSKPWTNTALGVKYDGIVANNSGFQRDHFLYVFDHTYEFHMCVLWYCTYFYPEIRQVAYADGSYRCSFGTDPNNLAAC